MSGFINDTDIALESHAFVQWKGTDLCMDFLCVCGAKCHFDGYFANLVECPHCARQWEMPCYLLPRISSEAKTGFIPKVMEVDEDMATPPSA